MNFEHNKFNKSSELFDSAILDILVFNIDIN